MMDGEGIYIWTNGQTYNGEWKNDKRHGFGTITTPSGYPYSGEFRNNEYLSFICENLGFKAGTSPYKTCMSDY